MPVSVIKVRGQRPISFVVDKVLPGLDLRYPVKEGVRAGDIPGDQELGTVLFVEGGVQEVPEVICIILKERLVPVHSVEERNTPDAVNRTEDIPGSLQGKGEVPVEGEEKRFQGFVVDPGNLEDRREDPGYFVTLEEIIFMEKCSLQPACTAISVDLGPWIVTIMEKRFDLHVLASCRISMNSFFKIGSPEMTTA